MTPHAALFLEQGLGSTVQCRRRSWAQYRAQRPVTHALSCPGRYGADATSRLVACSTVSSRHLSDIAGVLGRINWTRRSVGEIGRDRGNGVIAEPALSETENRHLVRGFTRGASGETENWFPVRGLPCEASSEAESQWARTRPGVNQWFAI